MDLIGKAEEEASLIVAGAGTEEAGDIQNSLASSQFFRMLGVDAQDLGKGTLPLQSLQHIRMHRADLCTFVQCQISGKLPKWILGIAKDVLSAQDRVGTVISDEVRFADSTYELAISSMHYVDIIMYSQIVHCCVW